MFRLLLLFLLPAIFGCSSIVHINSSYLEPSNTGVTVKSVHIANFSQGNSRYRNNAGQHMSQKIAAKLNQNGFVTVTSNLADASLTGDISLSRLEQNSWRETHKYKKKTSYSYHYQLSKTIDTNYNLQLRNGQKIANHYAESFSNKWVSYENYQKAKAQAPSEQEINNALITEIAYLIANDISPHAVSVSLPLLRGGSKHLETGITYLKKKRPKQAYAIFEQVFNKSNDAEDQLAAMYNMGVVYETQGKYEEAFEKYQLANQIDLSEELIIDALNRVERRFVSTKKANQQALKLRQ